MAAFAVQAFGYDYASQPKEALRACPLCRNEGFVEVATRDRYGYFSPTHVCAQCGLAFLNPRMTREAYSEFYAGTYRRLVTALHGKEPNEETTRAGQERYGIALSEFLAPLHGCERTILDLGGGDGTVAMAVAKRSAAMSGEDIHVTVVDPSDETRPGCERIKAFVEDWKPSKPVDLVLMAQTLDHVLDPSAALTVARSAMADDGLFFVDVVDWLCDSQKGHDIRSGIKIDHPYGWTQGVMTAALLAHGFKIVRMRYQSNGRHIGYACRKADQRGEAYHDGPGVLARIRSIMCER